MILALREILTHRRILGNRTFARRLPSTFTLDFYEGAAMTEKLIATGPVLLELEDGAVARLRLNRPEAANGMDVPFLQALHAAILRIHGDRRVRAVLLTGEGANFCA